MSVQLDDDEQEEAEGPFRNDAPGPDERDRDLMDGSWEAEYYSGRKKTRNWNAIGAGVAILVLAGLIVPMVVGAME